MVTPAAKREAVAHLRLALEVSERRACSTLGADRSSICYRSIRPDDAAVRVRLRELAAIRRRFGYRRLHILLRREGMVMNHKKLRRLYREERLQVRRRGGRKRALGTRAPMALTCINRLARAVLYSVAVATDERAGAPSRHRRSSKHEKFQARRVEAYAHRLI